MSSQPASSDIVSTDDSVQTATWTNSLPETWGIRAAVQQSKYRWCVREAGLWGIATSTAMTLHRLRMQTRPTMAMHAGFLTFFGIYIGSYYFCVKRRDYREKMIELMMQLNQFDHAMNMPEPVPVDEQHPFVTPGDTTDDAHAAPPRQYVAHLPERKEWQSQLPSQDAANVFRPVENKKSDQ